MSDGTAFQKFSVFIDYDNLLPKHKAAGILDVTTRALLRLPRKPDGSRASCSIRVYGGWYEGVQMTRLAEQLIVEINRDFPKVLSLRDEAGSNVPTLLTAELARATLEDPGFHLFHTYRRKGLPKNIRVETPESVGCQEGVCVLPLVKKILKSGNCPMPGCTLKTGSLVYRHEQKIVDTMLACDLIHAGRLNEGYIILVSGDDDFLPALRSLMLKGVQVMRIHPHRPASILDLPPSFSLLEEEL